MKSGGDVWYDAVAVLLATPKAASWLQLTPLNISVTPDGYTVIDPHGSPVMEALAWTSGGEQAFESFAADAIAGGP